MPFRQLMTQQLPCKNQKGKKKRPVCNAVVESPVIQNYDHADIPTMLCHPVVYPFKNARTPKCHMASLLYAERRLHSFIGVETHSSHGEDFHVANA